MKIVIDARMMNESGIGRYIRNLIANLQILDKKNEYFILHLNIDYQRLTYENNFNKILADFRWYGFNEQIKLPQVIRCLKPDLVHFPHFNVPFFYNGKFVVTIHDLIHQHFSMLRSTTHGPLIYKLKKIGYQQIFQRAIQRAGRILVPSNFVKQQLNTECSIPLEKILVTPEAVDEGFIIGVNKIKNNINYPYIFYVGNAHPHKNVEGLIKAFLVLKNTHNLKLVLAGNDHYFWQRIKQKFQDKDIIYKGYIPDNELARFYKNALCFVMPSYEEGFGIPILEAMACSCPVVSSNAGSLTEVGGDAALYFDPLNIKDIVSKISLMLSDKKIRQTMINTGLRRYKEFSWEKLAEQTLEAYKQCE